MNHYNNEKHMRNEKVKKSDLDDAKKYAMSAVEYGGKTLEELDRQEELLNQTEDTLDSNGQTLNAALKTLRGMTWGGYFANSYVAACEMIKGPEIHQKDTALNIEKNQRHDQRVSSRLKSELLNNNNQINIKPSAHDDDDKDLLEIEQAVNVLRDMSVKMSDQLEHQQKTIENIDDKTELVMNKTLALTIRASKLNDRYRKTKPQFVGVYQLLDNIRGQFISVEDYKLTLLPSSDKSTCFDCFVKGGHIIGLRSVSNGKYLTCNIWGHIAVSGNYFGQMEEFFLNLTGSRTGLLSLARNWGVGGWLKNRQFIEDSGEISRFYETTTLNISDQSDMVELSAIKVGNKPCLGFY